MEMTDYNTFICPEEIRLECGQSLHNTKIAYSILGNPNAEKTVWVCHALSGSSVVTDWWGGLFGAKQLFNLTEYRIICANVIGSCYGSVNADDFENPPDFPLITVKDMVVAHKFLAKHLSINQVDVLIGASLGGQQALEWAISNPKFCKQLILVATNAKHSPFGIAFNEAQRLALEADPTFGKKGGGLQGMKAARAIAMLSYRSYEDFEIKQADISEKTDNYSAASYVNYQGEKFTSRFKPYAYYTLSKAMDSHDVGRGRVSMSAALKRITAKTLVIGVASDLLFPLSEQRLLAEQIEGAELAVIESLHGHDAFLIEYKQLEQIISNFLINREVKANVLTQLRDTKTL